MPYCKQCGYEYTKGVKFCPDCQSALEEGEQLLCDRCNEPVNEDTVFCSHCGVVLPWVDEAAPRMKCDTHKENAAIGCCVICRRVVCDDCSVMKQGRIFCNNDEHVKAAFNWVVACTTSTDYEAQMVCANLEGANIPSMILSQRDRMYVTTVGDLAVTEVMVPKESLEAARRFLKALEAEQAGRKSSP